MKISFDIKYRPQIESGEYKVITKSGKFARVICWDRKGNDQNIVVLVDESGWEDSVIFVEKDGVYKGSMGHDYDLFILTPEPELTEFEKGIKRGFLCAGLEDVPTGIIKDTAQELLTIAKKELCKDCVLKDMDEIRVYKYEGPRIPAYWPPCYYGGPCTNPCYDCINCPRRAITVSFNTTTGTSAAKVEGKE